jgi:O-antigen/teichoic acid export membrane protein
MAIAGIFMAVVIGCNLPNMIRLLPSGQGYEAAAPLALILIVGRLADIFTGLNNELLSISSHYKFLFRASFLLLIVFIALNRILIPEYSFYGAAWGATLSLSVYNIAKLIFLYRKFRLQPFSRGTVLAILAGGGAALSGYFCPVLDNVIMDAALRSTVITVVFGILIYALRPSADINRFIQSRLGR